MAPFGRALESEPRGENGIYSVSSHHWGANIQVQLSALLLASMILLMVSMILAHHVRAVWKLPFSSEAGATLLVGLVAGGLVSVADSAVSENLDSFDATVFFLGLLPPIIFNSGYHLQQGRFFENVGAISLFAFAGTLLSTLLISGIVYGAIRGGLAYEMDFAEVLTMSAMLSATDPVATLSVLSKLNVHPTLFYVIFGESVFNDAVGLVLFNTFSKFIGYGHGGDSVWIAILDIAVAFTGSVLLGVAFGVAFSLLFKAVRFSAPLIEICVFLLIIYVPFFTALVLSGSGIVTILTVGIVARRYMAPNLSKTSRLIADELTRVLAHVTESAVFVNLGMSVFGLKAGAHYKHGLIFWTLFACMVARAVLVVGLGTLANLFRRGSELHTFSAADMAVMWFAGLRGAVAYAAASVFPDTNGNTRVVKCVTMVIVMTTVFLLGGLTETVVKALRVPTNVTLRRSSAQAAGPRGVLAYVDRHVLRPFLTNKQSLLEEEKMDSEVEMQPTQGSGSVSYAGGGDDSAESFGIAVRAGETENLDFGQAE